MNSNITLRSNVYINRSGERDDAAFLQHITDYKVLNKYNSFSFGLQNSVSWMTSVQKEILRQGPPKCALEKGTMSWGVPIGQNHLVCRCEQHDCTHFSICSQYPNFCLVFRETTEQEPAPKTPELTTPLGLYTELKKENGDAEKVEKVEKNSPPATSKSPNIPSVPEPINIKTETSEVFVQEVVPSPPPLILPKPEESHKRVIVSQETIIQAGINERIWVNAGPGTGKTYTVVQRLKKLLNDEIDKAILVLCFSRNAVQVIRNRLTEAIGNTIATFIDDGRLIIRTFDSFATYMLENELNPTWNYNQRIEAFIKMIAKNSGQLNEMIGYLIVDEIQDTVGVRARMLLTILDELKCGVLLLGDNCQAIFDWTIRDTNDMSFDALTSKLESRNFKKYELSHNQRQSAELSEMGLLLRDKILHSTEEEQEAAVMQFKQWASAKWSSCNIKTLSQKLNGNADLILCKTNGEAAHINQILFESSSIEHTMKQSSAHRSLAAWIAKVLKGNDGNFLSKEVFVKNAKMYEIDDVAEKWNVLKSLDEHPHATVLHIKNILAALAKMDGLPNICLNQNSNCAVISTVHRAKGSESEHVYWLDSPLVYDDLQEQEGVLSDSIKAAYVAATRAKKELHILNPDKNFYMRSVNNTRWIQIGYSKNKKPYCKGIAFLPEDIDTASFVSNENADNVQTLLSGLESGMPVDIYPNETLKHFDIFFDGQQIGYTSKEFNDALFAGFEATNHNKNLPSRIPDVYITAITTIVMPERADINRQYQMSGCWLGIELGGFPTIEWY